MTPHFFASILILIGAATAMGEQTLFDVTKPDMTRVKADEGVKVAPAAGGLRVTAAPGQWPGVHLAAPEGGWDLTDALAVRVVVRNVGTGDIKIRCRVDDTQGDGDKHSNVAGISLAPGRSGLVRVSLLPVKPDWVKVHLFGMRGYPWGMVSQPVGRAVDCAHVARLVIYLDKPAAEGSFEITSVSAGGTMPPLSPKLGDPKQFFPFIDEYGQYVHADWPGKTHSAADLAKAKAAEEADLAAHPAPAAFDKYGGWKDGPALKATGYFYPAKHEGKWWLVDPEGRLFWSHGIDCVNDHAATPLDDRDGWFAPLPTRDGEFASCFAPAGAAVYGYYKGRTTTTFNFTQANLMRKYGAAWQAAFADIAHRRLHSWGLNTIANWSDPGIYGLKRTPYVVTIHLSGKMLEGSQGYWGKFRDVFDPDFPAAVRKGMAGAGDSAGDPWCIGYFVDNEISWGDTDIALAQAALASPAMQAAKQAFIADLQAKYGSIEKLNAAWGAGHASWDALAAATTPPDAAKAHDDLLAFHARTCQTYFQTIREGLKEAAPNQLYLGCRFAWVNDAAATAAARYCDVVSYNPYLRDVDDFKMPGNPDVPMIIGEFHFGALDRGPFHTGLVGVDDQAQRAEAYKEYVRSALRHPQFVGCHFFQYLDEPTTGRALDEENYQIGFLDVVDTPYPETIQAAREIAREMYQLRAK